ncbi:MAG TPA: methyltransferase domain-containing protein [Gemmatales bacterium]|nr:methyltransferase domain-containing protein [Gemmatales bacterium]HMP59688.1 methyltransferase domain-containing protein [Gemmatales bacterium]
MRRYFQSVGSFLGQLGSHYKEIGAIAPSSRFLAREMVWNLRQSRGPLHILEAGPGTGVVTVAIAKAMLPEDRLDIVEINPRFVEVLRERIATEPVFAPHRDRIRVIHSGLEAVPGAASHDAIISGLPLNGFPTALVRSLLAAYDRLLRPGGTLTYFEYIAVRHLQRPLANRVQRRRLHKLNKLFQERIRTRQFRRRAILANLPPAWVRHLRRP